MANYRKIFFEHYKGVNFKCVSCGRTFDKSEITIDHRIPKRKGGTDDIWNLQPMCRSCNSRKRERNTRAETASTLIRATVHGDLGKAVGGMAKQGVKDLLGIKYKRK